MNTWHGYIAVENLNLNPTQAATLWNVIKAKGEANDSIYPQFRNHWRLSLDNSKGIFEALFNQDNMTVDWFKEQLGIIFNVDPDAIDDALQNVTFVGRITPIVTFSQGPADYVRFAAFGGPSATWEQSRFEVLGYLSANRNEWAADQ
jgi:hypothetical protein